MEFSYGSGTYVEGNKTLEGEIILGEHKLYLKSACADLAQTYIPLEKIDRVVRVRHGLQVHVRPSLYFRYVALLKGDRGQLMELIKDLIKRRGLKKRFLKDEWRESGY